MSDSDQIDLERGETEIVEDIGQSALDLSPMDPRKFSTATTAQGSNTSEKEETGIYSDIVEL